MIKLGAQPGGKDHVGTNSHNSVKESVKYLSDDRGYNEEENISQNGDEEGWFWFWFRWNNKKNSCFVAKLTVHNYDMLH